MKALAVTPGQAGSARIVELDGPVGEGAVLVRGLAMGICGTDAEITRGSYGEAPEGEQLLVLGHESLGEVLEAPAGGPLAPGDHVVGVVRRPDPVPCAACAAGEFDFCRNGRYRERGIKGLHGYGAERWRVEPEYCVKVDAALGIAGVLTEPTSVVAKAWEQIDRVGSRTAGFCLECVLVTGAGPVGLLAAMIGAQRGLDVHVLDQVESGPKPDLVAGLGATYHAGFDTVPDVDAVIEATGAGAVIFDAVRRTRSVAVTCLTGLSPAGRSITIDAAAINQELVLGNDAIVGSVNANLRHYAAAADALAAADPEWLHRLITRRVPLERFPDALAREDGDVKVVLEVS